MSPSIGENSRAHLSVPSGHPAFLFYSPSRQALDYSRAFQNVINKMDPASVTGKNIKYIRPILL